MTKPKHPTTGELVTRNGNEVRAHKGPAPSQDALDRMREVYEDAGIPPEVQPMLLKNDITTQRLIAAQHAMSMHFDKEKQIRAIMKSQELPRCDALKIHRIIRQLFVLEAHAGDRDILRTELRSKAYALWEQCAEEMKAEEAKTRTSARSQMLHTLRFLADLDGLKVPTKQQIEFSQTRGDQYSNVIEAQVSKAKEALLEDGLLEEAASVAKSKILGNE